MSELTTVSACVPRSVTLKTLRQTAASCGVKLSGFYSESGHRGFTIAGQRAAVEQFVQWNVMAVGYQTPAEAAAFVEWSKI